MEAPVAGQQQQSRVSQNGSGAISYTGMFSIGSGSLQLTMPHFVPGAAIYRSLWLSKILASCTLCF